jgi:hypothetical protein
MIPPYISDEVKSVGEKLIFDLFRNDPATKDWVVMHSLALARHTKRLYGEIDFLVLAPELGIFCLEVKAGNVYREGGIWKFQNRFGEINSRTRGPFEQSQDAMFSLIEAVKRKYGAGSRYLKLLYGYGVMFPNILFSVEGLEYEGWQVYDRDSRRQPISRYIINLAKNTKNKMKQRYWFSEEESIPRKDEVNELVYFFRGDFERIVNPKQMLSDIEEGIDKYTTEQYHCLDQMQYNHRCTFQGGAGTGKTMLAIESARRSFYKDERVLFLCFNTFLGSWLKTQMESQTAKGGNLVVDSFHSYLCKMTNSRDSGNESPDKNEEYFMYDLPIMALDAIDEGKVEKFDKIIIDEGQDLIQDEYLDVIDALLKGGLAGGKWEIYGDFENQAIYSNIDVTEMMKLIDNRGSNAKFRLTLNCRNTKPIGEEVSMISGFKTPPFLPSKVEGVPVEYNFWNDQQEELGKLEQILIKLRESRIPPEQITILSPFKYSNSIISRLDVKKFNLIELEKDTAGLFRKGFLTFSTIQSFKGLENSYIIIADINRLNDDEYKQLLYTGMSRPRAGLTMLINKSAQREFNEIVKRSVK